jgi:hypothetical protein
VVDGPARETTENCPPDFLSCTTSPSTTWSVIEAAIRGGASFTFDEADVYATAGFPLKLLVAASGVGELSEDVQDKGLSIRQQLPAVPS